MTKEELQGARSIVNNHWPKYITKDFILELIDLAECGLKMRESLRGENLDWIPFECLLVETMNRPEYKAAWNGVPKLNEEIEAMEHELEKRAMKIEDLEQDRAREGVAKCKAQVAAEMLIEALENLMIYKNMLNVGNYRKTFEDASKAITEAKELIGIEEKKPLIGPGSLGIFRCEKKDE